MSKANIYLCDGSKFFLSSDKDVRQLKDELEEEMGDERKTIAVDDYKNGKFTIINKEKISIIEVYDE